MAKICGNGNVKKWRNRMAWHNRKKRNENENEGIGEKMAAIVMKMASMAAKA
jgi:hypothetical protein